MSASFVSRIGVASVFALSLMVSSAANAYTWTEILLPPNIGLVGSAFGINDNHQVAVISVSGVTGIYGSGIFTPLPAPPAGYTVGALGINNAGVVVGSALAAPLSPEQGFILIGSTYTFFSRPGFDNTEPRAISQSGLITGYSYQNTGETAGFVYNPGTGIFTDVTPPGDNARFTIAQGMNKFGRISGHAYLQPAQLGFRRYAYIWQQGTLGKRVPFLDRIRVADRDSSGRGINDAGITVGYTGRPDGTDVGFVGSDSRGFRLLVPPGGDAAGAGVICEGINNEREVVCLVQDSSFNVTGAFIGSPEPDDP